MRIGLDRYTIAHRDFSPEATLNFAREHGFAGVQFLEPAALDADLNHDRLRSIARRASELGLYVEIGLPSPNPTRRSRLEDREISAEEHARDLMPHLRAVAAMGCTHARVYVGDRHDRFRSQPEWEVQLDATLDVLKRLAPALRDLDVKVAIETHADLTLHELLGLLDELPEQVAGVTLDTGNLAMRLDDPVEVVHRVASRVLCTHVKDAVLARTPRGLCWQARPVGAGVLPMAELLEPLIRANPKLNLSIELHPRTYDLPIHDPTWLAYFPHRNLPAILELANRAELRYEEGSLLRPEVVEAVPWADRDLEWLAQSAGYLRTLVPALEELSSRLDSSGKLRSVE